MSDNDDNAREASAPRDLQQVRPFDAAAFEVAVGALLTAAGFDPAAPHLEQSAQRVCALWQRRLVDGYERDPAAVLGEGFVDPRSDLVLLRNIAVHGLCPHHLVPFTGVAHVAYTPGGRLHGFGRIAALVDSLAHRLTYQEWLTRAVADTLVEHGAAKGAACVIDARQLCLVLAQERSGSERVRTCAFAGAMASSSHAQEAVMRALPIPA